MIVHASSKVPIFFYSVFFCALLFFAKPVEVKAYHLSGQMTTQEISQLDDYNVNEEAWLTENTTITITSDLTIKKINAENYTLSVSGYGGTLKCTDGIEFGQVTIDGNYEGDIRANKLTISGGTINTGFIQSRNEDLKISGGIIIFEGEPNNTKMYAQNSKVIISGGQIHIPESSITTRFNTFGIRAAQGVEISGNNTYIEARNNTEATSYSAITSFNDAGTGTGTITISSPLAITVPEDGHIISNGNRKNIADSEGNVAHYVVIRAPQQPQPQPAPQQEETHESTPVHYYKKPVKDQDKGDEEEHSSKPAVVNPDTVEGYFAVNGQLFSGVAMGKTKQGVAAQAVFNANRPVGWQEAFTFNMAINGKVDYTLKNGVLTIIIPKKYHKAGRTFAIMALDKNGKAWTFTDNDTNPTTVTATINVEGFAFALIYKD